MKKYGKKAIAILLTSTCLLAGSTLVAGPQYFPTWSLTASAEKYTTDTMTIKYQFNDAGTIDITGVMRSDSTDIVLPSEIDGVAVTSITNYAFQNKDITSIVIPEGVKSIGIEAFSYNESLVSVTLPESLESLGKGAFYGCSSLGEVHLPDNLTSLGANAFGGCSILQEIVIPDGVTTIEKNTFSLCTALTDVTLPANLTAIGEGSFSNCESLATITIPDSVTSIGKEAFSDCTLLTDITFPSSLESIGESAFSKTGLKNVVLPEGLTSIGQNAFQSCSSLESIFLPSTVGEIEVPLFQHCENLNVIEVAEDNPYYVSVDGVIFTKDMTTLIQYPSARTDTTYVIPDTVTAIGQEAFYNCDNLVDVTLSSNLQTIGDSAFVSCDNLHAVTFPDGLTTIEPYAFYYCMNLDTAVLPASVKSVGVYAFCACGSNFDITILNPTCELDNAIANNFTTIRGYTYSTAETYAKKRSYDFVSIGVANLTGDANLDGVISVSDAVLTLSYYAKFAAGLDPDSDSLFANIQSADINGDGEITVEDAVMILTYYAQQSAGLSPDWETIRS